TISKRERQRRMDEGQPFSWRLHMDRALAHVGEPLFWHETADGGSDIAARPQDWGDVIIARKDMPTSYHLSVVIDDALQGVSHVVRGRDLFQATGIHRLLQTILGLQPPIYNHHRLILDHDGQKLSKSRRDTSLRSLRVAGVKPQQIRESVGL
ncbi:TPA: tRNA glutamyl-Q(34) synthetase GluQRS, partial [Escherichia coli]|nr:tRNA glutamyl-Q(34) synthetase GluQRS [Escherichia coli]